MAYTEGTGLAGPDPDNPIFTPGVDYVEDAYPGESFTMEQGSPLPIRKRYILLEPSADRLNEFVNRMLGFPYNDAGTLYRNIPELISADVWDDCEGFKPVYYATKIIKVTPEIPKGPLLTSETSPAYDPNDLNSIYQQEYDTSDAEYTQWAIDVLFEQPIYEVKYKEDITNEWERYTHIKEMPIDSSTIIESSRQLVVWDGVTSQPGVTLSTDGTPVGTAFSFPEKKKQVIVDWIDVPATYINWATLDDLLGKVNDDLFFDYYDAETLLFQNYSYVRRRHQLGFIVYDVQFQMLHRPYGFNKLRNGFFDFQLVKKKAGGGRPFTTADFNTLFDS